jgi:PAS domain S-box-containing protein
MNSNFSEIETNDHLSDLIYDSASDAMFLMAVEPKDVFRCISVNRAYTEKTGLGKSEVIGKTLEEILPGKAAEVAMAGYQKAIKTKQPQIYEERIDFGFGLDIVETRITPVLNKNGVCTHLMGASRDIKPQKDADEQIKIMAQTLKSINECVSVTDTNNKIIFINEAFLRAYGYKKEELIGQSISIIKSKTAELTNLETITKSTIAGGWKGELINRRKDGTEFPVLVSSSPVYDNSGKLIAMVGVTRDLSEEKKIFEVIKEKDQWIKTVAENSPDIIYVFSVKENRNIYHNRSILELLGYEKDEMDEYAEGFFDKIIHPDDLPQYDEFFRQIGNWQKDTVFHYEYRMKTKAGDWRWFKGNEKEFQRESGKVTSLIGTVQDITEQKLAEEKLRKSEERYRLLADHTSDAIAMYDAHFNPLYLSPATETLAGYSMQEIGCISIFDLAHPDDKPLLLEQIAQSRKTKEKKSVFDYRIIHKDGRHIDLA